jgi:hypothetical protein
MRYREVCSILVGVAVAGLAKILIAFIQAK